MNPLYDEPTLKPRKNIARWVSGAVFTLTTISAAVYFVVERTVVEYYPDGTCIPNSTVSCLYKQREKTTFPGLFAATLGLLSIVLGTLFDRLVLIAEECRHVRERYGGRKLKMIKACFSGISWGPVALLMGTTVFAFFLIILLTGMPWFEWRYLVYIFSGIGVGPLIMQLLNLNPQSEVHVSQILEEKEIYVANSLAWFFYVTTFKQIWEQFNKALVYRSTAHKIEPAITKLLLVIPMNLINLDEEIKRLDLRPDGSLRLFPFPVIRLTLNGGKEDCIAIYCIKEPLLAMKEMSELKRVKSVTLETYQSEVKLFYRTLFTILNDPPRAENKSTNRYLLVASDIQHGHENTLKEYLSSYMQIVEDSFSQHDGHPAPIPNGEQERQNNYVQGHNGDEKRGTKNEGKAVKRKYKGKKFDDIELNAIVHLEKFPDDDDEPYRRNTFSGYAVRQEVGGVNASMPQEYSSVIVISNTSCEQNSQDNDSKRSL